MAGFATFAELLAAKAGKSAPQIEESLAQKAAQSEEARMLKLARDTEYNKALGIEPNPPAPAYEVLDRPQIPKAPIPSIDEIVAKGSVEGSGAVSLGPSALAPSTEGLSPEVFNSRKSSIQGRLSELATRRPQTLSISLRLITRRINSGSVKRLLLAAQLSLQPHSWLFLRTVSLLLLELRIQQ
jgi:hypothetical protein